MLTLGLFTSFLLGFSLLNALTTSLSRLERLGLAFPLGLATQTFLMILLDVANLGLTANNVLILSLVLIAALTAFSFRHPHAFRDFRVALLKRRYHAVALLFIALTAYLEYLNWTKCLFFPTFDRDSLCGFDTIGYIIAQEHTLKDLSIFQKSYLHGIDGPGSYINYMPFVQLAYAYVYDLGAESSKIIPALSFLSFLIAFFAVARRFAGTTAAAIITFFTLITPEFIAFSSLSITNVIHAIFASLGLAYTALWLRHTHPAPPVLPPPMTSRTPSPSPSSVTPATRNESVVTTPALLIAAQLWVRHEGIVFTLAAIAAVCLLAPRKKQILTFTAISLFPLLLWLSFIQLYDLHAEGVIHLLPLFDLDKAAVIAHYLAALFDSQNYYGLTFPLFAIAFLCNLPNLLPALRHKRLHEDFPLLGLTFAAFLLYVALLYQLDYKWDSIENVLAYSVKRFLFCFIPLLWLYTFSNRYARRFFAFLDASLSPPP
ncbi:MAG: hypothetical protein LBT73_03390 [Tannerellaceae bacterium]|jgi:hypothetical protein|nr:hypothetical protein [Tannerellaceae bacterium]